MTDDFMKVLQQENKLNERDKIQELESLIVTEESFAALLHGMNSGKPLPKRGTEKRTDAMSILMDMEGDE